MEEYSGGNKGVEILQGVKTPKKRTGKVSRINCLFQNPHWRSMLEKAKGSRTWTRMLNNV